MKLNSNFDSKLESTINLCQPLADWFERNQGDMAYLELTHKGCMHLEDYPYTPVDAKVLGRMANAGLTWLEEPDDMIIPEAKAFQAALAIAKVYEKE